MAVRVPRYLHLPVQILWFDMEDIAILMCCYVLWMVLSSWYVLPLVIIGPYSFMKLKATKPRGFMRHILYQYGFAKLKGYPPAMAERFEE